MAFTQNLPATLSLPSNPPVYNFNPARAKQLGSLLTYTRASAAYHINEIGTIVADAANVSRVENDGLLIESAATNLFINSEVYTAQTGTTVNSNAFVAPDGLTTADEMVETAANSEHYVNDRSIAVTVGDVCHYGVFIKNTGSVDRDFLLRVASTPPCSARFNPTTKDIGAHVNNNSLTYGFVQLKDGWFYVYLNFVAPATETLLARTQFLNLSGLTIYAGDVNAKIAVFGGSFYKSALKRLSYIKNGAAAVTRALDLLTMSATNFATIWRSDAYSVFMVFNGQSVGTCTYLSLHDGTADERYYLESVNGALTFKIVDGGVEQCSLSLGTIVTGTEYRVAIAWALNDVAVSINGGTVVTDTSATLATVTQLAIGANYAGANQPNTHIKIVQGWAERLSNSVLVGLSA